MRAGEEGKGKDGSSWRFVAQVRSFCLLVSEMSATSLLSGPLCWAREVLAEYIGRRLAQLFALQWIWMDQEAALKRQRVHEHWLMGEGRKRW